jgi:diguanylate cyclase (GGDEF)-like protein
MTMTLRATPVRQPLVLAIWSVVILLVLHATRSGLPANWLSYDVLATAPWLGAMLLLNWVAFAVLLCGNQRENEPGEASSERHELRRELAEQRRLVRAYERQLQHVARHDALTGCLTRSAFFEQFSEGWRAAKRYGQPIACVIVDPDHLKLVNDNYGPEMGDEVLRRIAGSLLESARDTDRVCRYSGEKFCVLLPHVNAKAAGVAAERFRRAVMKLELNALSVTVSVGCSSGEFGAESMEELLEQADRALQLAKRRGRNRVEMYRVAANVELREESGLALTGLGLASSADGTDEQRMLKDLRSLHREVAENPETSLLQQ